MKRIDFATAAIEPGAAVPTEKSTAGASAIVPQQIDSTRVEHSLNEHMFAPSCFNEKLPEAHVVSQIYR